MRRFVLLLATMQFIACGTALADDFSLPGLQADSEAYAHTLTERVPAGGTPQARRHAEQAADAAIRMQDWGSAAAAWETRISLGEATPAQWLALAEAQLRRTPSDPAHALQAA
jgi:alpha-2-macroglobulin